MSLAPRTRLGPYEIIGPLGVGGMGEVYRARDVNLKREVAIKVLPADVASDRERLGRFQREAEVLASLNHPHIAHVYGIEERALVMELVGGDDLSQRIARGPMPIDEALPIARQIAEALEAAHEAGIVHRDLKPGNIKVRPDGTTKVLDFGLAKGSGTEEQGSGELANSPTITSPAMTMRGVILGTAAYMAPEQAKGKAVDRRADIWAFGCVLYEMLTGKRAFQGEDVTDTIAEVLKSNVDWAALPANTPLSIRLLLRRCLERDLGKRAPHISIARLAIDDAAHTTGELVHAATPLRSPRRAAALVGMGAVALVGMVLGIVGWTRRAPTAPDELRLQLTLPAGAQPDLGLALSPDGRQVAFAVTNADGTRSAWVRDLDDFEARPVDGAEPLDQNPLSWSADSRWLGFTSRGAFMKADVVAGGKPVRIWDGGQIGAAWNTDGAIVFGTNPGRGQGGSIFLIPAGGGEAVPVTKVDAERGEYAHHHPTFLPDGRRFLYLRAARPADRSGIYVGSIEVGPDQQSSEPLLATSLGPVFFVRSDEGAAGSLIFMRDGSLVAQAFNPETLALSGEAQHVASPVGSFIDRGLFWVSRSGTIVYAPATAVLQAQLSWVDRQGQLLRTIGAPGQYTGVSRSPDGSKAAVTRLDATSASEKFELWLWDLTRGAQTLFWFKSPVRGRPIWSPDGARLLFAAVDNGPLILERSINGVQDGRIVYRGKRGEPLSPTSWSPDGRFVLFTTQNQKTATDIWVLTPHDGTVEPLIQTVESESNAEFSPDGRWIAYSSTESGRNEVYVTAVVSSSPKLTVGGGPWRVSNGGGILRRWRADGREIFYDGESSLMAAQVSTDSGFQVAETVALRVGGVAGATGNRYGFVDASRDGREILIARPITEVGPPAPLNVLLNWRQDSRGSLALPGVQ